MLKSSLKLISSTCFRNNIFSLNLINDSGRLGNTNSALLNLSRSVHATTTCQKTEDRRMMLASLPPVDEGTIGEKSIQIDNILSKDDIFPDETTPFKLFNGVPFKDLPIFNIRVTHNNTIISVTNSKGETQMIRSCGVEGFKNARKGTNVAAQATATTISLQAVKRGYKQIRVRVRGLGPGRMSAIKGLQIGGLDIVSITDNTKVTFFPQRARKARRL